MKDVALRIAEKGDIRPIRSLLKEAGLPFEDIDLAAQDMIVAVRGTKILGTVGLEARGENGLLRSLAVAESHRGNGLGRALVAEMIGHARGLGIKKLYILTLTADRFFAKGGFEKIKRETVPPAIQGTAEFASLCPVSSTCMKKDI